MAKNNSLKKPKRTIKLADGKEYTLSPFTLHVISSLEQEFDCDFAKLDKKLKKHTASAFQKFLWILLRDQYPELTFEKVGNLVEFDQVTAVVEELNAALEGLEIKKT